MRAMVAPPDTDERNRSLEERVSRLEGGCAHLATKADIERVLAAVERVRTEGERNRADIIKLIIQIAGIGVALIAAGFAFLRLTGTG